MDKNLCEQRICIKIFTLRNKYRTNEINTFFYKSTLSESLSLSKNCIYLKKKSFLFRELENSASLSGEVFGIQNLAVALPLNIGGSPSLTWVIWFCR
jgi:hypothetical protein